jgi:ribosomal protein S18 acetylase RimI-like enzyme
MVVKRAFVAKDPQDVPDEVTISTLPLKPTKSTNEILASIQSLERRTFPTSEALDISKETSKRNTHLLYAKSSSAVIGYLVYINTSSGLRIHKVCIAQSYRRQGIATSLIEQICQVAKTVGKDIDLWVDEGRLPARECYIKCGFTQVGDVVVDYYAPGRNGIRMVWSGNE